MARFYETQYIKPTSAYVPLPFEAMAAKLQTMQQAQDAYKAGIDAFDKYVPNLPVDEKTALANKEYVQSQLESLRKLDYNDAVNRDQIYKTIKDVRDFYSPQGGYGLQQNRFDQYNANKKHIQETYKDNPTQMGYLLNELDKQFMTEDGSYDYDNKALRKNPQTGQWENTGISSPKEWSWVDREKWASDTLKDIEHDQNYRNYGFSDVQGMEAAVKAFREGNTQHKDYSKIQNAMILRAQGNPNLLQSTQAEGQYFNYGDQSNWLMKDENGNTILNPNSLLGKTIIGTATGGQFERTTANTQFIKDDVADARAKKQIEDPLAYIGKEVPATNYVNTVDTGEKLGAKIEGNKVNTQNAWTQMMRDNPQLWDKYGLRGADGKFDESRAAGAYQGISNGPLGLDGWMEINGANFGTSSGKVNGLLAENKKLSIVDKAAEEYATKVAPVTGPLKNLTPEDKALFENTKNANVTTLDDKGNLVDNPAHITASNIASKYGYKSIADMERAMKENVQKHDNAKNEFIKTNSEAISKETYAEGVMPVLNPDGSVNTNATYDINKQLDKYFTDNTSMTSVVTLEPKDQEHPEGGYKTLNEIKAEEEAAAKERGETGGVKISKPWYSSLPDTNGNAIMYVTIGNRDVPINSNSLTVTYQPTPGSQAVKTTIGELNSSPATKTNTFLSGVYSSGAGTEKVGGYPLSSNPNVKIVTAGKPQNGSWSGGTELKVIEYNPDGTQKFALQGQQAFNYLTLLQSQNKLK